MVTPAIAKAARAGNTRGIAQWQDRVTQSREAKWLAVRRYDQSSMGVQLSVDPREDETAWLDADLG